MTPAELTRAQREILRLLPQRIPIDRVDRLWIFAPQMGKARETGLFVVSLVADAGEDAERRTLMTVRYQAEQVKDALRIEDSIAEEGRASPDRIDRVIAGVLSRGGDAVSEPLEERIERGEESWLEMVERLDRAG